MNLLEAVGEALKTILQWIKTTITEFPDAVNISIWSILGIALVIISVSIFKHRKK